MGRDRGVLEFDWVVPGPPVGPFRGPPRGCPRAVLPDEWHQTSGAGLTRLTNGSRPMAPD
eukprot:7488279-Pyramimonas_sp.AAC.1